MPGLSLDFYALVEVRMVRLFTLVADINFPLGLDVTSEGGDSKLVPIAGKLDDLVGNVRAENNELLSDQLEGDCSGGSDKPHCQLVRALVGSAEPLLASALGTVTLPSMNGLKLTVRAVHGIVAGKSPKTYQDIGIFAGLSVPGAQPHARMAPAVASLTDAHIPSVSEMKEM